jgi:hypothetical protein
MQCTGKTAQVGETTLTHAIAEFLKLADDLGDEPSAEEHDRLSHAFDALRNWTAPAASFAEAVAALRVAHQEFCLEQEADGLARAMLSAVTRFLDGANVSAGLPMKRRWSRRTTIKMAA